MEVSSSSSVRSIESVLASVRTIQEILVARAKESATVLLLGYTHMRRGQPVVFAQYLLAWFWALERDRARLRAAWERVRELPLGAGALAGRNVERRDASLARGARRLDPGLERVAEPGRDGDAGVAEPMP